MSIQQTVLRVQTNKLDPNVTIPTGTLNVISGTTGFTYSGTGTNFDPYTGSTTGLTNYFIVQATNTGGIISYNITGGTGDDYIYINDVLYDAVSSSVQDEYQINVNDVVKYEALGSGATFNMSFTPIPIYAYENLVLDLYSDIPIKINKSFAEVQDIAKRNSDYSIGLQIPGSKKNNRFFESFYNVDSQTLFFDPTKRVPAKVLINDEVYFDGYLRLNKVSVINSKVEYDVTLYSNIGDLFGQIGNNLLVDLNFNDTEYQFNHTFNKNVVGSWDDSNFFSDEDPPNYFYPIVHNGYEYSGSTPYISGGTVSGQTRLYTSTQPISGFSSNAAAYAAGVKRFRINSPEDGILDTQLKPALNVKALIELIFKTYGYSITSEFFNTPWFKLLYLYGYFSSDATKFSYKTQQSQTYPLNGVQVYIQETYVNSLQTCLGFPNIRVDRTYTIYVVKENTGIPCYCSEDISLVFDFKYFACGTGSGSEYSVPLTIPAGSTGTTYSWISSQPVNCGGGSCVIEYTQNFGLDIDNSNVTQTDKQLAYVPSPPNTTVFYVENDYIDFSVVVDPNYKQIDFLSSIAKKFNLVFIQDPDTPNKIIIEPYEYYIGSGSIRDWSNKLSFDKGFTVQPALNFIESELILTDSEDGDYGNKTFKDQNNRIYGENKVYNPTDFKSQTKKIDTIFSSEYLRKWDTEGTAPNGDIKLPLGINYALANNPGKSGDNEIAIPQYKGLKTKPKLFYYLGAYNYFLDTYGEKIQYSGATLTNAIYINNSSGTNPGSPIFLGPVISHTMPIGNPDENKVTNDSICNLFNSELPTDIGVDPFNVYTEQDLYYLFYQNRIGNLFNKNTRFLSGYFNLSLSDIKNLQPKDLVKINEQYFLVNKINGYDLTNPELTQVELIQTNNVVREYPSRYFFYYYCDTGPSPRYKFKTDMTNPNLRETNYGWSILYDYNIGVLGGNASGYTSTFRDTSQGPYKYVPYHITEVDETTYNTFVGALDRTSDTMWMNVSESGATDLNFVKFPTYCFTSGSPTNVVFNVFTGCTDFSTKASAFGIEVGSSTGATPSSIYTSGITLNVTDTGYIKYNTSSGTTYQFISSTGNYDIPDCADCTSVLPGFPYADVAVFTISDCGNSC